jgi:signal transduction histidine kinase
VTAAHLGRHRLFWRIWIAILATVALFALLAGTAWRVIAERPAPPNLAGFAEIAEALLPPAVAPPAEQQAALDHWSRRLGGEFALLAPDGSAIAQTDDELLRASVRAGSVDRVVARHGPVLRLQLADGRTLLTRRPARPPPPGPALTFVLIALGVGVGAFPAVRRLTRRLERLQGGVEAWGAGDLRARVAVEGRDEVARLAASFNAAAARIEQLVGAHRSLLANASHELRSPLARIRLGLELISGKPTPELRAELARDIGELDQLIDEILLASRLEGVTTPVRERVDLTALAAEECARAGGALQAGAGGPINVKGEARMLQRLVRNLLDNARRHGGVEVDAQLKCVDGTACLEVLDRGPGVAVAERERVFEPFYRAAGASEASGGVGLGLALVRQIARQHGGDAVCLARDGGGSNFRVTLPLA